MDQHVSHPFLIPLTSLEGIGPAQARLIGKVAGGETLRDLLFHLPESYIDRTDRPTLSNARAGGVVTLNVTVVRHEKPATPRQPLRVVVGDGTGFAELVFFGRQRGRDWERELAVGASLVVSGKLEAFGNRLSMAHPDYILSATQADRLPAWDPVWPLTAGLSVHTLRKAMHRALQYARDHAAQIGEWHDPALLRREGWPGFVQALLEVHQPDKAPDEKARQRLAYDELLAHQVAIGQMRLRTRRQPGRALVGDGALRGAALERFGHSPTPGQVKALAEIDADLAAPHRMLRLLQGDVGAGKTLVALLAMLRAVEAGHQAALMAPTEVLARQHLNTLARLAPVQVALLTGSVKGVQRRNVLLGLSSGRIPIVVGTHALFQDKVQFRDLALAVIDEQHRFGVDQRLSLGGKGEETDVLVMTATPIPRTVLLLQWGEMAISRLEGKPAGRQPIQTSLHSLSALDSVVEGVARALQGGAQIYWVCPLVAESEAIDLAAAEARHAALVARLGADKVGLAHGQQPAEDRDRNLADFAAGRLRLLVATTVIEVGVDVPQATIMVIEHAERFGLAQLHQLRGRVGRGSAQSYCLLVHDDGLGETARRRLTMLRETEDGFRIADEDFRLRGGGDLLGTRQSGLPGFRMADPARDERLLHIAAKDAALVLDRDPDLASPRGQAVQWLQGLMGRDTDLRTLQSG